AGRRARLGAVAARVAAAPVRASRGALLVLTARRRHRLALAALAQLAGGAHIVVVAGHAFVHSQPLARLVVFVAMTHDAARGSVDVAVAGGARHARAVRAAIAVGAEQAVVAAGAVRARLGHARVHVLVADRFVAQVDEAAAARSPALARARDAALAVG